MQFISDGEVHVYYRTGYKYQLARTYTCITNIRPKINIKTEFITLLTNGMLTVASGYAWDGPSGLTIDTASSIRGSLVHDALYELMRKELLGPEWREAVDILFREINLDAGMWEFRANAWYRVVNAVADFAADPANRKIIYVAP